MFVYKLQNKIKNSKRNKQQLFVPPLCIAATAQVVVDNAVVVVAVPPT